MNLSDFNDKQKSLIDPKDRKSLGIRAKTYEESMGEANDKVEKILHDQYCGLLRRYGFNLVLHAPMYKKSNLPPGWPDFTVMHKGLVYFEEFKSGKNKLSKDQEEIIESLRKDGFTVGVHYDYESAMLETLAFFGL